LKSSYTWDLLPKLFSTVKKMDKNDQANKRKPFINGSASRSPKPDMGLVFRSLIQRSIDAWQSITYVETNGYEAPASGENDEAAKWKYAAANKVVAIKQHTKKLSKVDSLDSLLACKEYWFFQLREAFVSQKRFTKWSANRLDDYIILPIDYGFANNQDCFFVSHFWRAKHNPDEDGEDLRLLQQDLADDHWSYIWVDWTCMPQGDERGIRSMIEKQYFKKMLRCIPMIIRDCAFAWYVHPTFSFSSL
jgi:hypothetical protein